MPLVIRSWTVWAITDASSQISIESIKNTGYSLCVPASILSHGTRDMVCNYSKHTDTAPIFRAKQTSSVTPPIMSDVTSPLSLTYSASCAEHCFPTLLSSDGASPPLSSLEYSPDLCSVDGTQHIHNHARDLGENEPIKFTSDIHTPVPQEAISAYSSLDGALGPVRQSTNRAMEGNTIADPQDDAMDVGDTPYEDEEPEDITLEGYSNSDRQQEVSACSTISM